MQVHRMNEQLKNTVASVFNLYDNDNVIIIDGAVIKEFLYEHFSMRFIKQDLNIAWTNYRVLYWNNYLEQLLTQFTEYDPTKNYNYEETKTRTTDDGDETKTRTPDETKNYIETTNTYNHTKTTAAGTGANAPKVDTYNLAYDTEPKHTGYTVQTGETTETETTNGTGDKVKTVDNMKYTETKSHTPTTKTIDNKSITADKIEHEHVEKSGYINANIAEYLREKIDLHTNNIIIAFINRFIDEYTFYIGGGENDIEFV